jgi:hypothetical protein
MPSVVLESYNPSTIHNNLVREVTDFYRYIFANDYLQHYLVYPNQMKTLSPKDIFPAQHQYTPISSLDQLQPLPIDSESHEQAVFWHDPEFTYQSFKKKLTQTGIIALLRNQEGSIVGLTFAYIENLENIFHLEGWEDPLYYSGRKTTAKKRDFSPFLNQLNQKIENHRNRYPFYSWQNAHLREDTKVFLWNTLALAPGYRGLDNLLKLTNGLFENVSDDEAYSLIVLGESDANESTTQMHKACGSTLISDPFNLNEKTILHMAPVITAKNSYTLSKKHFIAQLKANRKVKDGSPDENYSPAILATQRA